MSTKTARAALLPAVPLPLIGGTMDNEMQDLDPWTTKTMSQCGRNRATLSQGSWQRVFGKRAGIESNPYWPVTRETAEGHKAPGC